MLVKKQQASFNVPLPLDGGGQLSAFELAFELTGRLNRRRDNAILVCHALSSDAHVAGQYKRADTRSGWWDAAIGPGKMFDTRRFCVMCSAVIGGGGGSTGPGSVDPATGRPFGLRFPVVTIADMVRAQQRLTDRLGIRRFYAVVGGCMGGFQVLRWMVDYPDQLSRAILIGTSARTSAHTLACNAVIRSAVQSDPCWAGGDYYGRAYPEQGMALAARIGSLVWMNRGGLEEKYGRRLRVPGPVQYGFEPEFEAEWLMRRVAEGSRGRFDPNALLYLTRAMDYFDLTAGGRSLRAVFKAAHCKTLSVSYASDWRYPPSDAQEITAALCANKLAARHVTLESAFGHGAFLFDLQNLSPCVVDFLVS